jgi:hypothetical protein
MRLSFALVLLLPSLAIAQPGAEQKKETIKWVTDLQAPGGGFYLAPKDPKSDTKPVPSLRATNGAVRVLKYLGADIPNKEKHAEFVLKCFDPKTGAFAEMGGKPDVGTTSVGVMAAMELGVPKEKFAKAMDYIKDNAKTFEEVRIGAAAVEAWGVKDCPFKLDAWQEIVSKEVSRELPAITDGGARMIGSLTAFTLRLGLQKDNDSRPEVLAGLLNLGQVADGGWRKEGAKESDIETTYRVMRAYMLLKQKPKDVKKLRAFIAEHRNKDGGCATKPGDKSNMSGTYYCTIISKWLDDLEK